ncbi:MAG: hypothetical protein LKE30_01815 [Bacteroidales bacterium]|nr:hypothetical protein [Bacteroidales bacterium]
MTRSYKSIAIILSLIVCMFYTQSKVNMNLPMDLSLNTKVVFSHSQKSDNNISVTTKTPINNRAFELVFNESRTSSVDNNNNFELLLSKTEDVYYRKTLSSYIQRMNKERVVHKSLSQLNILII